MARTQISPVALLLILLTASAFAALTVLDPLLAAVCVALLVGITAGTLAAYRWPWAFLILALWTAFLKSLYIPGLDFGSFGVTPYMVFIGVAALGYGLRIISGRQPLILPVGLSPLLVFIGLTTLSLILAPSLGVVIGNFARTASYWLLFFLLVQELSDQHRLKRIVSAILIQAIVLTAWGIAAGLQVERLGGGMKSAFLWQQYQKNDFAAYLAVVIVTALATLLISRRRLHKAIALFLLVAAPAAWMFTFSRGGFLAIVVSAICMFALQRSKILLGRALRWIFLLIVTGTLLITLSSSNARNMAVDGLRALLTEESVSERSEYSAEFRIELATAALAIIADHPLLGVGFDHWQFVSPIQTTRRDPQTREIRTVGYTVHNRPLLIAANSGIVALAGYWVFVGILLLHALQARRFASIFLRTYLNAFIAAAIGISLALLVASTVLWEWPVFGILAGLINLVAVENTGRLPAKRTMYFQRIMFNRPGLRPTQVSIT